MSESEQTMSTRREELESELEEARRTEEAIKARLGDFRREEAELLARRRSVAVEAVLGDEEALSTADEAGAELVEAKRRVSLAEEALRIVAPRAAVLVSKIEEIDLERARVEHEELQRHADSVRAAEAAAWETISPAATASSTLEDAALRREVWERAMNSARVAAPDLSEALIYSIVDSQMAQALGGAREPIQMRPSHWSQA